MLSCQANATLAHLELKCQRVAAKRITLGKPLTPLFWLMNYHTKWLKFLLIAIWSC